MKLLRNLLLFSTASIVISCSSMDDISMKYPTISAIKNTECECPTIFDAIPIDNQDDNDGCIFKMTKEGSTAKCTFISLQYPCDFGHVNIEVAYENNIMTIVEYPSSDLADCRCKIDVSFSLENMPQQDFLLKIYRGNTDGQYNANYPKCIKKISFYDNQIELSY